MSHSGQSTEALGTLPARTTACVRARWDIVASVLSVVLLGTSTRSQSFDSLQWCSSSTQSGASQHAPSAQRPQYNLDPSAEDWSFLRLRSHRTDPWDPIKYISLGRDSWYLSLGAESREMYELYHNYNWGAGPQDSNGYLLQRYMGHADVHFGKCARVFFELKSGLETGRNGGPRSSQDEDQLDINQLFLDLSPHADNDRPLTTVRIGRQELNYGEGTLLAIRELNVRRTFDGLKVILQPSAWRIDALVMRPVQTTTGFFNDTPDPSQTLWGVWAAKTNTGPSLFKQLDVYYLGSSSRAFLNR